MYLHQQINRLYTKVGGPSRFFEIFVSSYRSVTIVKTDRLRPYRFLIV